MSEDKDIQEQFSDTDEELLDFVDLENLEDLEGAEDLDLFGDLGDIGDLGDFSELMDDIVPSAEEAAAESAIDEVVLEEPIPEVAVSAAPVIPDILAPDEPEEEDAFPEMGDLPDLDSLFAEGEETLAEEEDSGTENIDSLDGLEEADAIAEGAEETPTDAMADLALSEEEITADMDTENLDGLSVESDLLNGLDLDLDFSAEDSAAQEEPEAEPESGSQGIDSMLDGILGNLDMGGSMEDSSDNMEMPEEEGDPLADLLGLGEGSDTEEADSPADNMLDLESMVPEEEEEKQPGFFKRVFGNIVTDEIAQQEREDAQKEEEEAALKEEEAAKEKEEKEAKKAEKQAEKEAKAEEKKKAKEERKAEKAAQKAERKAEREAEEAAELEVVGKLNKVGVSIIVIATAIFLVVEIAGTNMFGYSSAKREAINYFEMGKYTEAYQEAIGTDMQEKDKEDYDKIKVVMKVQHAINSYQNYDRIKYYPEALDALLRGIKRYDANIDEAMDLEVEKDMQSCRTQILSILRDEFGLSEQEAYSILAMNKDTYTDRVVKIAMERR